MENNEELQYAVLSAVIHNFDINLIHGKKYSYGEIGEMLVRLRKNGCISDLSGELKITNIGISRLEELEMENNWNYKLGILPQYKYFVEKKSNFDIYLKKDSTS
ncbi:hypothetical protein CN993_00850 [Bacillus thuringiensis]|uniref:hypothetical protein n=1 Tax=Bacillus thuringiensis TaxID=1428 RepID=UPI000BFBFDF3|nr:hypothetical protein [Bacillus thuringiensis]PGP49049.1 hypothetical protein CN993_00850 [Bacillus thuringiensis]HDR7687580.1 hypothetical protein [Bacillus toyonensis]